MKVLYLITGILLMQGLSLEAGPGMELLRTVYIVSMAMEPEHYKQFGLEKVEPVVTFIKKKHIAYNDPIEKPSKNEMPAGYRKPALSRPVMRNPEPSWYPGSSRMYIRPLERPVVQRPQAERKPVGLGELLVQEEKKPGIVTRYDLPLKSQYPEIRRAIHRFELYLDDPTITVAEKRKELEAVINKSSSYLESENSRLSESAQNVMKAVQEVEEDMSKAAISVEEMQDSDE